MNEAIKNRDESYKEVLKTLGARQKTVYDLICTYGGLTSHEVATKMVLVMGSINGRTKELEQRALIMASGSRWNSKTKRYNTVWVATTLEQYYTIREAKIAELHERAVHLAVDLGNVASPSAIDLISKEIYRIDKKLEILI